MKNFFKSLFGLNKKEKKEEPAKTAPRSSETKKGERSERNRYSEEGGGNRRRPQGNRRKPNRRPRPEGAGSEHSERPQATSPSGESAEQPKRKPRRKPRRKPESEQTPEAGTSSFRKRESVVNPEESEQTSARETRKPRPKERKETLVETQPSQPEPAVESVPAEPVYFDSFGLNDTVLESLQAMNFREATPVQQQAIPYIMQNRDLIACAQTGTGKTAAFLLPIMHNILETDNTPHLDTLVLAPTRELALQIDHQLTGLSYFSGISSQAVYGGGSGQEFDREKKAFQTGTNIIVATPGKLIQHMNLGYVDTSRLKHFVLDEADRMLDMGFFEDIMRIVSKLPTDRQTLLFSATMPPKIRQLAAKILRNPAEINIAISKTAEGVHQTVYSVHEDQKLDLLTHILDREGLDSVIVFTSRKSSVRAIERSLRDRKINARGISSDLEQKEREDVLREFRNRNYQVLVATDIMSRGIDIADLDMVINYDVPNDAEDYVHRVGRTARAKATGEAITFVTPKEQRNFYRIEELIGRTVEKPGLPEDMSDAPAWLDPEEARRRSSSDRGRSSGGGRSGGGRRRPQQPRSEGSGSTSAEGEKKPRRKNYRRRPGNKPSGEAGSSSES